mmetsp:Transcript_4846/g.10060  ORF Transcript_4846/g.10060 Transcript_4846/m.10060 type:complete len:203 (-) Transcript_4846:254-862(-)
MEPSATFQTWTVPSKLPPVAIRSVPDVVHRTQAASWRWAWMICFGWEGTTAFTGGFFLPSLLSSFSKAVVLGMYFLADISDDFIAAAVVVVFAVVSSVEKPNQLFRFSSCFLTVCSSADSFRSCSSISFKVLTSEDRRCFSSMKRVVNRSFSLRRLELSSEIIRIASLRPAHCCSARLARCSLSLTCVERCSRALSCFSFLP